MSLQTPNTLSPALCVGYATFTDRGPVSPCLVFDPSTTSRGLCSLHWARVCVCLCVWVCVCVCVSSRGSRSLRRLLWGRLNLVMLCVTFLSRTGLPVFLFCSCHLVAVPAYCRHSSSCFFARKRSSCWFETADCEWAEPTWRTARWPLISAGTDITVGNFNPSRTAQVSLITSLITEKEPWLIITATPVHFPQLINYARPMCDV